MRLPLPVEGTGPDARPIYTKAVQVQIARFLQQRFFETWNTHPGVYVHSGAVWARISVQVWTEVRRVAVCVRWLVWLTRVGCSSRTLSTLGRR